MKKNENWDLIIEGKTSLFDLKLVDVWRYRDLLLMFVRRDFISFYKQTILGRPLWFFIQPIFTTLVFTFCLWKLSRNKYRWTSYATVLFNRSYILELEKIIKP